ncbi:MAG: hypothetical protein V3S47_02635, partial [Acidobacteriota bacterium]
RAAKKASGGGSTGIGSSVGSIAGAVIGGTVGGPPGAAIGAGIGGSVGGATETAFTGKGGPGTPGAGPSANKQIQSGLRTYGYLGDIQPDPTMPSIYEWFGGPGGPGGAGPGDGSVDPKFGPAGKVGSGAVAQEGVGLGAGSGSNLLITNSGGLN